MHDSAKPEMSKTAKRPKQPFDPALDAPVVLTPAEIEKVAAGTTSTAGSKTTIGRMPAAK